MPEKKPKPSRLWRVVLVISLALNLAVVGIVVGAVSSGRVGDGPPRSFDIGQGPIVRAMLPRERLQVARSLRQDRVIRDLDFRGRITSMIAVLSEDTLDEAALRALMAEQAERMVIAQEAGQDAFVSVIVSMTPERRAAFAAQLQEELSRPRRDGPRDGSGDGPRPSGG
ncbi:MAG: periplasmic heavy metal sensor [Pseudomonadota bacterium]